MRYTTESCFHWKSRLTPYKKRQIVNWVKSLKEEERQMLEDIIEDVQDEERLNVKLEADPSY